MDTQELLAKIARYKDAMVSETDPDVKAKFQKKIESLEKDIAQLEVAVEKKEEKIEKEEEKKIDEADAKLAKYKAAIYAETDPDVKARFQKRIDELESKMKGVKEQIKEEKKELQEQKEEIKEVVKEVKSVQKAVRKAAIKKVTTIVSTRKAVSKSKTATSKKLTSILSELEALISKNKKLKSKYEGKGVSLERDAARPSKPFGYRFKGKDDYRIPTTAQRRNKKDTYYEGRPNRADVKHGGFKKGGKRFMLADGGMPRGNKGNDYILAPYDKMVCEVCLGLAQSEVEKMSNQQMAEYLNENQKLPAAILKEMAVEKKYDELHSSFHKGKMAHGGMMAGVPKHSRKKDAQRFAKPSGWRWKNEAVNHKLNKKRLSKSALSKSPSKYYRDLYPDLVYFEDRASKSDKHPSRKFQSL